MTIVEAIDRMEQLKFEMENYWEEKEPGIQMAIEALKFQQEYQQKVQRCIERIKNNNIADFIATQSAIDIIRQEMGCEE